MRTAVFLVAFVLLIFVGAFTLLGRYQVSVGKGDVFVINIASRELCAVGFEAAVKTCSLNLARIATGLHLVTPVQYLWGEQLSTLRYGQPKDASMPCSDATSYFSDRVSGVEYLSDGHAYLVTPGSDTLLIRAACYSQKVTRNAELVLLNGNKISSFIFR